MLNPSKHEIDEALKDIEWARNAPGRYASATRKVQALRDAERETIADEVAALNGIKKLEAEMAMLQPMLQNQAEFIKSAQRRLREVCGVQTVNLVNQEIGAIALARLADGYSLQQVATMIGCASGTVASIKAGRYRYTNLPDSVIYGARGRGGR